MGVTYHYCLPSEVERSTDSHPYFQLALVWQWVLHCCTLGTPQSPTVSQSPRHYCPTTVVVVSPLRRRCAKKRGGPREGRGAPAPGLQGGAAGAGAGSVGHWGHWVNSQTHDSRAPRAAVDKKKRNYPIALRGCDVAGGALLAPRLAPNGAKGGSQPPSGLTFLESFRPHFTPSPYPNPPSSPPLFTPPLSFFAARNAAHLEQGTGGNKGTNYGIRKIITRVCKNVHYKPGHGGSPQGECLPAPGGECGCNGRHSHGAKCRRSIGS